MTHKQKLSHGPLIIIIIIMYDRHVKKLTKQVLPLVETMTGCVCRRSVSGKLIIIVNTEPNVVPIHNVGSNVVGS